MRDGDVKQLSPLRIKSVAVRPMTIISSPNEYKPYKSYVMMLYTYDRQSTVSGMA